VRRLALFASALLLLAASCGSPRPPSPAEVSHPAPPPISASSCAAVAPSHASYRIFVDGAYVGREVRTRERRPGPFGEELRIVSVLSRHVRSGPLDYDVATIRSELTALASGSLLRGHFAAVDPMFARIALVGFNGTSFQRIFESCSSVLEPLASTPQDLPLSGHELVGLRLSDHLLSVARGATPPTETVSFYDPSLTSPVPLTFSSPEPGEADVGGEIIRGVWVSALRDGGSRAFARFLFGAAGEALVEEYPSLHQVRARSTSLPPFPTEATRPSSSLLSRAYLGAPEQATQAVFRIETSGGTDPLAAFAFLGEPRNQVLTRTGVREAELRVSPGAPDGSDRPSPDDTRPAQYIESSSPEIVGAFQYLRSAGRTGSLPAIRRANATPVIARAALVQSPGRYWKDPASVANIVSRFVFAILPDKRATFSMADAVTTLERGTGDCTEHSVLFTALMRAAGIPTRLVAGLYLSQGGYWVYHMWATYWDGSAWRQIDPIVGGGVPGALYVAIGRGATRFTDVRPDVASFLDRAFSGVEFDLVSASSNGESLKLSYPRTPGGTDRDAATFNASVLAFRGDARAALDALDASVTPDTATVTARLFRAELLVDVGDNRAALDAIAALREITSLPANTAALDALELDAVVASGDRPAAEALLSRMEKSLGPSAPAFLSQKARVLFAFGAESEALDLIASAVAAAPGSLQLLTRLVDLVSRSSGALSRELATSAEAAADEAFDLAHYADPRLYAAAGRLARRLGHDPEALSLADSGLVLAPADPELLALREAIVDCAPNP
jgi:hypothetical protein